jgi:thioredoxin reductase (NADPH)
LLIYAGAVPQTEWLAGVVERDAQGYVVSGQHLIQRESCRPQGWTVDRDPLYLETSVPGIFAAGDVRNGVKHGVAAAVGDGDAAVSLFWQYLATI